MGGRSTKLFHIFGGGVLPKDNREIENGMSSASYRNIQNDIGSGLAVRNLRVLLSVCLFYSYSY
jgi:hypothetical protein